MTWIDGAFIALGLLLLLLTIRGGGSWVAGSVAGGFFGMAVADTYALSVGSMIGGFPGSALIAGVVLFLVVVALCFALGWLFSKIGFFVPGVLTLMGNILFGIFIGALGICLGVVGLARLSPKIEKSAAWKKSTIVVPWRNHVDEFLEGHPLKRSAIAKMLDERFVKKVGPIAENAADKVKDLTGDVINKLKK